MTTNLLDQLLETNAAREAAQAAQKEAELVATLADLNQAVAEALGDLWPILKPFRQPGQYTELSRGGVRLAVPFEPEALELAPFYAHTATGNGVGFSRYKDTSLGGVHHDLAAMLADRRQAYPEWKQKKLDQLTKGPAERLDHYYYFNVTEEEAGRLRDELISIDPSQSEKWNGLYKYCVESLANDRKNAEEKARRAAEEKRTADAYAEAYRQYRTEHQAALEANGKLFADLQARFDEPFNVYELIYALMTADEDGEQEIGTRAVYVTNSEPDPSGFWNRYHHHELDRIRYASPVALRGPLTFRPSEAPFECTRGIIVPAAQASLRFQIHQHDEAQAALDAVEFRPLPEPPAVPEFADYREHHRIEARVNRELAGEPPELENSDDIPF